jgi:hypothetical protein
VAIFPSKQRREFIWMYRDATALSLLSVAAFRPASLLVLWTAAACRRFFGVHYLDQLRY